MADQPAPEVRAILDEMDRQGVLPFHALSVPGARRYLEELFASAADPRPVGRVRDLSAPGPDGGELPVRVYEPESDGEEPRPALVWFHGGGFVLGNLDSVDPACRALCAETGRVVVSANYRHAPEHPFPAAPEDCYAGTRWTVEHAGTLGVDPDRVAVGGTSAGGNLAAVVALLARDRGGPEIDRQVLVYPVTNRVRQFGSYEENAEGYFLTRTDMEWFHDHYLERAVDARNPYAYPLEARDLSGLPSASVVTAGFDPLRDEGIAYAERLEADGVEVTHHHYPEMIHGFFSMLADPEIERAWDALGAVGADLSG
ncbi:MAG: alpha/beta hydrolase [Haloarculaceae archaeon]